MDNDDRQIGRILSRREVLGLFGAAGAAALVARASQAASAAQAPAAAGETPQSYLPLIIAPAATATPTATSVPTATPGTMPSCVVRPAVTEGPYFVDEKLNRSDIRSDPGNGTVKPGALLALAFNVSKIAGGSCTALSGATVDVWHCDAAGLYSDESANNTVGQKFLRGYQVTDANGLAAFTTIYPGWYSGRAVHIHFKIRITTSSGASFEFTSQLFFDDTLTDQVFAQAPYTGRGARDRLNSSDNIYSPQLLLTVSSTAAGYAATFDIGLNIA